MIKIVRSRREYSVELIILLASIFFSLAYNTLFWTQVSKYVQGGAVQAGLLYASLFVAITGIHFILLALLCNRWTLKIVLPLVLMISAAAAYFMARYTVYLDTDMLRNVLHTDTKESRELMTVPMITRIALLGLVPSLVVWWARIRRKRLLTAISHRIGWMVLALAVVLGAIFISYQPLSSLMRNHKDVRYLITPGNYLIGLTNIALKDTTPRKREAIGLDAKSDPIAPGGKPKLLVLVVGETVRAQNWGLNGYARQTTPRLSKTDVISFTSTQACGTATETSLPCMFSPWGRADFDLDRMKNSQSLMHVLDHAGVATMWIDNQSGCKGVCEGLPFESIQHVDKDSAHCTKAMGCYDAALLERLQNYLSTAGQKDTVVVLHQLGNHGPSYYARYPAQYKVYTPECLSDELSNCNAQQITNSYDNAIVATDAFLTDTLDYLKGITDRDVAMMYVSDHGESLGEGGLYLHGLPYAIAPDTQKKVPMFVWLSQQTASSQGINPTCIGSKAQQPTSHDNLFHTVLGLMRVRTGLYVADRDLLKGCESPP